MEQYKNFEGFDIKNIVFDIDGVIACGTHETVYSDEAGWNFNNCEPIAGIREVINHFKNKGLGIVLQTARREEDREVTGKWLVDNDIYFDRLIMEKPFAVMYVDDKAFRHRGAWTNTDIGIMEHYISQGAGELLPCSERKERCSNVK